MRRLLRALAARCPVCGSGGIWASFGDLEDECPRCGYRFAREEGYWTGALIANMAFALILFFVVFVGGMALTWPDVPWNALSVATIVTMILAPIVLYRQSKTLWVWVDITIHPYSVEERDWERR